MIDPMPTPRRGFLGHVAAGAAALGIGSALPAPLAAAVNSTPATDPQLEAWFGKLKGKHRMVFDSPAAGEGMVAIWPRVYINTTKATHGENDGVSAMIILRHHSLGLAIQDSMWEKYEFGKVFHVNDAGGQPATKNPFAKIEGLPITGLGITELLASGVLVGACDVAMTVYSSGVAKARNLDAAAVRKEWVDALHPGVQLVPSGVYAVGRAQELGCGYCYAA